LRLAVAFTPALAAPAPRALCVVIDVLRATTMLTTLLERGISDVIVAADLDTARALRAAEPDRLLAGEAGGLKPAGFDLGNSPREALTRDLGGKRAICCTTNGTDALRAVAASDWVLLGCVRNAPAVARTAAALARHHDLDITLVCSGRGAGRVFALDDALTAGLLVHLLLETPHDDSAPPPDLDDAAQAARALYDATIGTGGPAAPARWEDAFRQTASGRHLVAIGLGADLDFCAAFGASATVPRAARSGDALLVTPLDTSAALIVGSSE
jgi:2-phosphosulfolactate phosphatase